MTTPVMLDPVVAAVGLPAVPGAAGMALLADLSHHDPDHHPLEHARLWAAVQTAGASDLGATQINATCPSSR
jgi:hypothetical protein